MQLMQLGGVLAGCAKVITPKSVLVATLLRVKVSLTVAPKEVRSTTW